MVDFSEDKLVYYGYITLMSFLVYLVFTDIYFYLVLLFGVYFAHQKLQQRYQKFIEGKKRAVLVTGCDTGFGHQIAQRLAEQGFTVFAGCLLPDGRGAQTLKKKKNVHVLELDVTKDDSVKKAVQYADKYMPQSGLWAVLNNAAINRMGDVEFMTMDIMKQVFEVNFFGTVRVTKAFLPYIRKSRGRVINVTSVKGRIGLPQDATYIPTKYAGEGYSDCLRREMTRFGVKVVIVEPGNFGGLTGMLNDDNIKRMTSATESCWTDCSEEVKTAYGRRCIDEQLKGLTESNLTSAETTDPVIDAMEDAVMNVNPKYRYLVHGGKKPLDWYCVCAKMNEWLPEWIVDWFIEKTSPQPKVNQQVN